MDYAALFAAGVAGLVIGTTLSNYLNRELVKALRARVQAESDRFDRITEPALEVSRALANLRANCFLTDTDGVRRRYDKVSRAVRERAEGGEA